MTVARFCIALVAIWSSLAAPQDPLLKNGSFADWTGDGPVGWRISEGASKGEGPESVVRKGPAGGLCLEGDAETRRWRIVSQSFTPTPNACYRLRGKAKVTGLRRDAGQYDNCWVGLTFLDAKGAKLGTPLVPVTGTGWTALDLVVPAPAKAASAEVRIFLSKTGRLEVRTLALEAFGPERSFDLLVEDMARNYSFFELRKIDWKALTEKHRAKAAEAKEVERFVEVVREMLAELKDMHVWIRTPDGMTIATFESRVDRNADFKAVAGALHGVSRVGGMGIVGTTAEGYAFVGLDRLKGDEAAIRELEAAFEKALAAPALILDLRGNGGGSENIAERLSSFLTDQRRVYAKSRFRNGPGPADFADPMERAIAPRGDKAYAGPVACLIGPGTVSSAESFALMIKALPTGVLLGQPTRGASGNPRPIDLPNGVSVHYSRWMNLLPDGTPIEGRGVAPHVTVEHAGTGDPTFEAARAELKKRLEEAKKR